MTLSSRSRSRRYISITCLTTYWSSAIMILPLDFPCFRTSLSLHSSKYLMIFYLYLSSLFVIISLNLTNWVLYLFTRQTIPQKFVRAFSFVTLSTKLSILTPADCWAYQDSISSSSWSLSNRISKDSVSRQGMSVLNDLTVNLNVVPLGEVASTQISPPRA